MTPNGVVLYGAGVKLSESHRYKPPTCGGLPAYGDLSSSVFEGSADGAGYNSVLWKGTLGSGSTGKVLFQFAAATASTGPWTFVGPACVGGAGDWFEPVTPDTPIELKVPESCVIPFDNKQFFRYKVRICSSDCSANGTFTPTVDDVVVNWAP